jgi:hypothetical protein
MRNYLFLSNIHPGAHVQTASTYLRGTALSWFTYLPPLDRQQMLISFDTFAAALFKYFHPLDVQSDARQRLNKITQTGSVAAFNSLYHSIVQKLPLMEHQEKVDIYRLKLKPDLQLRIATQEFTNLTDNMKTCIRIESLLQQHAPNSNSSYKQRFQYPQRTNQSSAPTTAVKLNNVNVENENDESEDPTQMSINLNAMRTPIPKMTDAIKEECRRLKLCFRCRQPGHGSRTCTYFSKSNQSSSSFRPSQNISQSAPTRNFQ